MKHVSLKDGLNIELVDLDGRTVIKRSRTDGGACRLLHDFFQRNVPSRGNHHAVECNGEVLTYSQLDAAANQIAAALKLRGVGPGSFVALYLEKSCGLFAAMLGILKTGAAYVPVDPKFPVARVESIFEDANVAAIISATEYTQQLAPPFSTRIMILDELLTHKTSSTEHHHQPVAITPRDACYVIYTSGSTGRPKGVIVEHRHAVNFVRALSSVYHLNESDRVYQGFSICFDASVEEIWGAFSLGGTLVVPSANVARSSFDAAQFIEAHGVTFFSTVPSFLAMIESELKSVRLLVLGGETCPSELVNRFATPGRRLLNTYGPTETTVVATAADCRSGAPVLIGKALPGYLTYVLDEQMRPVKPGEIGELYIGGAGVARGYMNRPELTSERFLPNPFNEKSSNLERICRTYDLVRLGDDGQLQFLGRSDAQIKIRGFRVELSEIEAVLMEHPSIRASAASIVEFGSLKELAAYVVVDTAAGELDRTRIAELLHSRLPEYMVPRYLEVLDELPVMTSGKLDRNRLPLPRTLLGGKDRDIVPPANRLEQLIVEILEQQFQFNPISVEDDFFLDLRGHSLIVSHVVTELRARLGTVQVSVSDLYNYRSARILAGHLTEIGINPEKNSQSERAKEDAPQVPITPLTWFRWPCAILQALSIFAFYGVISAPLVFAIVIILQVLNHERDLASAAAIGTTAGFIVWPSWLLLSIAIKWIVIGRYKAGRYPVWGFYYFRWWLVSRFQALSWSEMFVNSPLMSLYYKLMGAKVGKNTVIGTPLCTAFDLVSIGDGSSIGSDTQMLGYRIEDGWLILGNVTIGSECFVGAHCCIGLDTTIHDQARLDDMSHLADGSLVEVGTSVRGSPARLADIELNGKAKPRFGGGFLYGLLHLGLVYLMGYILLASLAPGLAFVGYALYLGGPAWGVAAGFMAAPLTLLWYLFLVVAIKWIAVGRIIPGVYALHSRYYLRYWFLNYLLNNTRHIALTLYATMTLPSFLRLLGARIGSGVEISTAMHIMPDLLEIEDGSFLADACIVGGQRIHDGVIEIRRNKIGKRTFIGNSAFIPSGSDVGDNALIGVMSTPPSGATRTSDGTRWLGSPGFSLPRTQNFTCFSDRQTYNPSFFLSVLRFTVELLRIFLPGIIVVATLTAFCATVVLTYSAFPLWAVAIIAAGVATIESLISVAIVAALKRLMIGKFEPTVKPLWSGYVWRNEVVNALYETVAASAMTPLMGTPYIAPCLRMMGCKIGRWVFLETTLFSEFDLVEIGDYAALNLGATIQTHLFEDRVMKADRLKIGEGCSVGNMAVVLYDTVMKRGSWLGPLSVLMKGEVLPPFTRWAGIPTRSADIATRKHIYAANTSQNASLNAHSAQSTTRSVRDWRVYVQSLSSSSRSAIPNQFATPQAPIAA
jgi:non-ribosomal peptide synthetase-like protein